MPQAIRIGISIGIFFAASGCSGLLIIESQVDSPGGSGGCSSSSVCGLGRVCVDTACVDSDGPCSTANPDGDCPLGRVCSVGICRLDASGGNNSNDNGVGGENGNTNNTNDSPFFDCTVCAPGELCGVDRCVEPTDSARVCSEAILDGACPIDEVCVAGSCTPIRVGKNDCSMERPLGLCPPGAVCSSGFCVPIDEPPCSAVAPSGGCPAGQACEDGECAVVACMSPDTPFGACPGGLVCLDGECLPETALLTCEEVDCAALNRESCVEDDRGVPNCGECVAGYFDDGVGACAPDSCVTLGCASVFRDCDGFVPATCLGCIEGYVEVSGSCVPQTCATLNCGAENRSCSDGNPSVPSQCGACVDGFVEQDGTCRLATCDDIGADCAAQNRTCEVDLETGALCGDCVSGATVAGNGQCEVCDTGDCTPCATTQDCRDRNGGLDGGGFCSPVTQLCTVECEGDDDPTCPAPNFQCTVNNRCAQLNPGGAVCAAGAADPGELVEPLVYLLLDRSGSMNSGFGGGLSRWATVGEVLFSEGPTPGLVTELQSEIRFALATFGTSGTPPSRSLVMDYAPANITELPPTDNRDALSDAYDGFSPAGGTPSAQAFNDLLDNIEVLFASLDSASEPRPPTFVVFATDGQPEDTLCTDSPHAVGEYEVLAATDRARDLGITTFALAVGPGASDRHLQDIANVGIGAPSLGSLDYDTYTLCDDPGTGLPRSGVRVNLDGPDDMRTCTASDGSAVTPCGSDQCGNSGNNDLFYNCIAVNNSDYEGTYASFDSDVAACGYTEDQDFDDDGVVEMAACYVGSNATLLRDSLNIVFESVQSCVIQLATTAPILSGTVFFDDDVIERDVDWVVRGSNQIEIIGPRCDELQDGNPHFVSVEIDSCTLGG